MFALLWLMRATAHPGMPAQAMRIGTPACRGFAGSACRGFAGSAGLVRRLRRGQKYDEK